jgi:hypothetical protein
MYMCVCVCARALGIAGLDEVVVGVGLRVEGVGDWGLREECSRV